MQQLEKLNFSFLGFLLILIGATLCKGLNRGLGTLLAGSLAFLVEYIVDSSGRVCKAVFIGAAVFLVG